MRFVFASRIFFLYLCISFGSRGYCYSIEIKRESGGNPEQFPLL